MIHILTLCVLDLHNSLWFTMRVIMTFFTDMVFSDSFSNISIISWRSVLSGGENWSTLWKHQSATTHWQAISFVYLTSIIRCDLPSAYIYLLHVLFSYWWTIHIVQSMLITTRVVSMNSTPIRISKKNRQHNDQKLSYHNNAMLATLSQ
jgi:hypothetical protein